MTTTITKHPFGDKASPKYADIGTVIHGTMKARDLIPAFLDEIERLGQHKIGTVIHGAITTKFPHSGITDIIDSYINNADEYLDSEEAEDDIHCLMDELNSMAPPYVYFGAHCGDGSDFGFWPDWDAMEQAVLDREMIKVFDLADIRNTYTGAVMVVNDYGYVTFGIAEDGGFFSIWASA